MDEKSLSPRIAMYLILHALFWVFAMILVDSIWGDAVAQWMAVVFSIANGLVATFVILRILKKTEGSADTPEIS
ncbi:hypothetical protein [Parvularcula sp. IMCC14364]|uniref:hypothetical protein n=1 Tax=Parvularcula sp. IMCC14364 TaxID=3067902 RepID=UPI002742048A|nr:hypothetical protein [Parvularcula sp. IMCC14364]